MSGLLMLFVLIVISAFMVLAETNFTKSKVYSIMEEHFKKSGLDASINTQDGTITISDKILFPYGSDQLIPSGKEYLNKLAPIIADVVSRKEFDQEIYSIDLEGYTSERTAHNEMPMMYLSIRRSHAVWKYIYSLTFPNRDKLLNKLKVSGWGNMKATSQSDKIQDRRVVFQLQFRDFSEKLNASLKKGKGNNSSVIYDSLLQKPAIYQGTPGLNQKNLKEDDIDSLADDPSEINHDNKTGSEEPGNGLGGSLNKPEEMRNRPADNEMQNQVQQPDQYKEQDSTGGSDNH